MITINLKHLKLPYVTWDEGSGTHCVDKERCVDLMVKAYIECAYWADAGPDGEEGLAEAELSEGSYASALFDCIAFLRLARWYINDWSMEQLGRDFWLTRNRHGTGFWDREFGSESARDEMTELSHRFGEVSLILGDDGLAYLE